MKKVILLSMLTILFSCNEVESNKKNTNVKQQSKKHEFVISEAQLLSVPAYLKDQLIKYSKFIADKNKCLVSFSEFFLETKTEPYKFLDVNNAEVICIWGTKINKGTINEFDGCVLGWYNPKTNRHRSFWNNNRGNLPEFISRKKCKDGGLEELLEKKVTRNDFTPLEFVLLGRNNIYTCFEDYFLLQARYKRYSDLMFEAMKKYKSIRLNKSKCKK